MNIRKQIINGKEIIFGTGTPKEVESLDKCKNNKEVFDYVYANAYIHHVGILKRDISKMRVDRGIYGKRKIIFK